MKINVLNKTELWNRLKPSLVLSFLVCVSSQTYAANNGKLNLAEKYALNTPQQQITIKGKVVSAEDKMGIPGVNVNIKGVKGGVSTDFDGGFSINVSSPNAVLVFSGIGLKTQEIKVGTQKVINVTMAADVSTLNEVVVVGYGTQKKTTLTGAVEVVSSKVFEDRAVTNVGLALQGQSPGLVVTRTSSRPGSEGLNIQIRGYSSINGSSPLVVIDGVPAISDQAFLNMNPDDIESISVLKDGSAAIYGSRAANGVILVTTKKGKGEVKITFNSNFRYVTNGLTKFSPSMNQYATMWIEANKEETKPNWWIWDNEENLIKLQQGVEGAYHFSAFPGRDFFIYNANRIKELFGPRFSYQHNLAISGGGDKSSYRLSASYADNQANLLTAYDGEKQMNVRFSYDYKITDKLKLESNVSINNINNSKPSRGLGNILYSFDMPFYPAKNPYGQWNAPFNGVDAGAVKNSAAATSDGGRNIKKTLTGRIDLKAIYDIGNGFSFEGLTSIQNERVDKEFYVVPVQLYNWYGNPTFNAYQTDGANNVYSTSAESKYYYYYQALARYNKTFNGVHNVSVMAGVNGEKFTSQGIGGTRLGFTDLGVYDISLAPAEGQTNGGYKTLSGRYSYIARLNYNYDERYIAEFIGRKDGNSRFGTGYKFKNFGSAQLGWVFTKEKFLKSLDGIVDFGKIRATIGSTGNEAKDLRDFEYLSLVGIGSGVIGQAPTQQTASYLENNGIYSPTRTWEKVVQKNIGIDLGFLNNRLTTTFDVYQKENIGMLINIVYPSVLGANSPKTNNGNFNNKGWEFRVGWKEIKKDYGYNMSFNIGNSTSKVSGVLNGDSYGAGQNGVVNGYGYKPIFVYKTDGFFKDQAEVDAYYAAYGGNGDLAQLQQTSPEKTLRPGDTKKVDVAGTGIITGSGNKLSSLVYAGDSASHYTFGINLGGNFKGFDINTFFQGHLKQNVMRTGYMAYPFRALFTNQNPRFLGKTWTEENPNAEFPRLTVNPTRAAWNYANNDFMLQNNRYIRLKTLVVGYTIPERITKIMKLDKVRFYFSGNDLWEASKIKDGFDPEAQDNATDGENAGYPFGRTWSFGVNIGF
ncbi:SusC/RagA family TonB-linked outer membrane protein [Flavobacterium daejeonense]|uniref:SusC/RagA family TonB-linked outer membrane protein n=1 Tax=Flavobacterium daejeonense TaxID=350893 RepID=UPI00047B7598|nr:SusC/RagA family TonB-linked outer membrane protein [Flavobacterium daejeonense]